MCSTSDSKKMNTEGDRLSRLPDDLIHKILSFVSIKHAVQTSVLSSRWRFIWTSMPCLVFSSKDFRTLRKFSKFVTRVLYNRDSRVQLSSVKLSFRGTFRQPFVKRIFYYALSHNVEHLNIDCFRGDAIVIASPRSVISSKSLRTLSLTGCMMTILRTVPVWDLPALTTLNLDGVPLYDDDCTDKCASLLTNCANLKSLTVKNCRMSGGLNGLSICHPGLTSLTLEDGCNGVNVVTPQLKNLVINHWRGVHMIFADSLFSLRYVDDGEPLQLSSGLICSEKVDICVRRPNVDMEFSLKVVCLLQQLVGVEFLTLNLELVKLLSVYVEVISHQPSPFTNLKSLKIYPAQVTLEEQAKPEVTILTAVTISTAVKNYFLDSSPGATFTMVSHEEIRAVMNVTSARNLMTDLQVILEQSKENCETNTAHMESHMVTLHEQGGVKSKAQPDVKIKCHFEERMTHIKSYWEDLNKQLEKGSRFTSLIISMLRKIQAVLAKVPTSHRDKLQVRFSGLRAEAETIMDNMMDCMKVQCDKMPSRSNVFLNELATSSQQS